MDQNNSQDDNNILFDEVDQNGNQFKTNFQQQMKIRQQFQEEEIMHEPGMQEINKQGQDLNSLVLNRPKTSAQEMKIKEQEQQHSQQNQFEQIQTQNPINQERQNEESSNNSDEGGENNISIVQFQSEMGDQVEQEDVNQQRVGEIDLQQQPLPSSINQILGSVSPFPPNLEINYIKEQMQTEEKAREFLTSPLIQNKTLQCQIKRDKSGFARLYPVYHVRTKGGIYLFSAKKVAMNATSNYLISMNSQEFSTRKKSFLGKVRSNFLGTEFILWDDGKNKKKCKDTSLIRNQLGVVKYENHIMQNKGPRQMIVLLPKVGERNLPKQFQPLHENQGIQYDFQNQKLDYIEEFINKPPRWDQKMRAHVLNFYGRVDKPSVKNFQLIKKNNQQYIHLQFGRCDDLSFNLDFCFPLSPLQAFQICVTSFDFKFACE